MDNIGTYIKAAMTAVFAAVSVRFGAIGDLLWLFIAAVSLDYVTGIAAAIYNRTLSSGIGLRGAIRKVGECAIIAVAIIVDDVVARSAEHLGIFTTTHGTIAAIVTIWLILNELISILENIERMSVPLPPFLESAIKLLKKHTEASQKTEADSEDTDDTSKKD